MMTALLVLACLASMAGVQKPFKQFTQSDYVFEQRPGDLDASQNTTQAGDWYTSQLISLKVQAGTDVYLTHKVQSWYEHTNLDGLEFDMLGGPQRYGYIFKNDFKGDYTLEKGEYDSLIHWGDGSVTDVTYVYDVNNAVTSTRTGYFLDSFKSDAEIYLVMTTLAADTDPQETVDSYQYVQSEGHGVTTLVSRTADYKDLAKNIVVNFGIDTGAYGDGVGIGREFVAVYNKNDSIVIDGGTTGGPLPGPFTAAAVAACLAFVNSARRRRQ